MAEVMDAQEYVADLGREPSKENTTNSAEDAESSPPPPPRRGRDRESRERRDERDFDRRGGRSDINDRNRSPPPSARERDAKRRRPSPSPPPPPYRDRRGHSPVRRSSPNPPYKRSRRDDFEGRPRGGHGDRRFGNHEQSVGSDRETGGRDRYPNERLHGRYSGRSSGDWDSGRVGLGDAFVSGSTQREGLKSYKQFIQELEDDILPAEAERRYQEYKSGYIEAQKRTYFGAHKDEDWLKDKYHPTNLVTVIERRNDQARKLAKDFILDLQSGTLDLGPGVTPTANKAGQSSEPNSDDEVDDNDKRRRYGRGAGKEAKLLAAAPKAHPVSSEPRRTHSDVEQAQALVRKLDAEKGIEDNILSRSDTDRGNRDKSYAGSSGPVVIVRGLTSVKGLEGIELLDTLLTYLWRIHGVDYYGMTETNEVKGLRHVRFDGKTSDATSNGDEWENKLDSHWQSRLNGQDPLEVMTAKEKIDTAAVEALDPYIRKIKDEKYGWKYGCGAKGCTKLFHAAEFVTKHLKLKHPDLVLELTSKVREDLYFQNYMSDENAPGGIPVMQPSIPKEKLQRRRPGLDGRLKDDRGGHRDRSGERFDWSDNSQMADFQSKNDGGLVNEQMFDSVGGQGFPVAGFPSDMVPPPVLMPVPGAGPLGPFVPAPPEVAMQMFREQGNTASSDGSRNGRLGPRMNGPAPIIALPPTLRQDPRRLRSYQDLDAPEDEVTVIDYRSL